MPDSVDRPAPLSTTTRRRATVSTTSSRLVVRGRGAPVAVQVRVGRVRTNRAYVCVASGSGGRGRRAAGLAGARLRGPPAGRSAGRPAAGGARPGGGPRRAGAGRRPVLRQA